MSKSVLALLAGLAFPGMNAWAVDVQGNAPPLHIAQKSAIPAGPVAAPGANMSKPNPFPSSSAAGSSQRNLGQDEAYSAAIEDCESLPSSQRKTCVDDINKRFGQM